MRNSSFETESLAQIPADRRVELERALERFVEIAQAARRRPAQ